MHELVQIIYSIETGADKTSISLAQEPESFMELFVNGDLCGNLNTEDLQALSDMCLAAKKQLEEKEE